MSRLIRNADNKIIYVDAEISELLQSLIKKGYVTDYSCGGHMYEDHPCIRPQTLKSIKDAFPFAKIELSEQEEQRLFIGSMYVSFHIPTHKQVEYVNELTEAFTYIKQQKISLNIYTKGRRGYYTVKHPIEDFTDNPDKDYRFRIGTSVIIEPWEKYTREDLDKDRKYFCQMFDCLPDLTKNKEGVG